MSRATPISATVSGRMLAAAVSCIAPPAYLAGRGRPTPGASDLPLPRIPERTHRLTGPVVPQVDVDDVLALLEPDDVDRQVTRQQGLHATVIRFARRPSVVGERALLGRVEGR